MDWMKAKYLWIAECIYETAQASVMPRWMYWSLLENAEEGFNESYPLHIDLTPLKQLI